MRAKWILVVLSGFLAAPRCNNDPFVEVVYENPSGIAGLTVTATFGDDPGPMYDVDPMPGGTGGYSIPQDAIKSGDVFSLEAYVDGVAVATAICRAAYPAGEPEPEMHIAIVPAGTGYALQCGAGTQLP